MRIGILGGTFDPVHLGHLIIAENAYSQYNLDEVWIMPSGNPPHKLCREVTSAQQRGSMVRMAVEGNTHLKYSGFELEREGYTYTADTLRMLSKKYAEAEFYFIIGEDSLDSFHTWREPDTITGLCKILVAVRSVNSNIDGKLACFMKKYHCDVEIIVSPYVDISSSDIRRRVQNKMTIKYMVPEKVEKYICDEGLYKK